MSSPIDALYPEAAIGGYTRADTTMEFYQRIRSLLAPSSAVLNLGAGRGEWHCDRPNDPRTKLMDLRGETRTVVGLDVDPAISANASVDHAVVYSGANFPLKSESFDFVISDWVAEHVDNPENLVEEVRRVLRPGGWFAMRTPNRWGYIGLGATSIPNRFHVPILRVLQPDRKEIDIFPTRYKMNSWSALARLFPDEAWNRVGYAVNGEPAYFGRSALLWRLVQLGFRLTPPGLNAVVLFFAQKK
ncbi:MAG: class I SAM-dependent methyltransferase [Oceanicaulis sp.]